MRPARLEKQCTQCGAIFLIPPCRDWREHECSSACKAAKRIAERESRRKNCEICRASFVPRPNQLRNGGGRFCSVPCARKGFIATDAWIAGRKKGGETYKKSLSEGRFKRATGAAHPQWQGGPKEALKRRIASGKARESLARYRKNNPEKVREWDERREGRAIGRLPRGTISRLLELQKERCAICKTSLKDGYHKDHITPLALGGKHERLNIQLLCPPCNLRKSSRNPISFAQLEGRLL